MPPSSSHTPIRDASECTSTTPCSRETPDCLRDAAKPCTVLPALKEVRAVQANALGRQRSQTHIDQAHTVDELQVLLSSLKTGSAPLPDGATLFRVLQRNSRR